MSEDWEKKKRRIDDLFLDFGNFDELIDSIFKDMREQNFPRKPLVMGFSMKMGPEGEPIIQRIGNVRPAEGKPAIAGAREPLVDVITSEKQVTITAELPGAEKKDIAVNAPDKNTVEISVQGGRTFYKRLNLKQPIKPKTAKAKFKNGILEVCFERETPGKIEKKKPKAGIKIE